MCSSRHRTPLQTTHRLRRRVLNSVYSRTYEGLTAAHRKCQTPQGLKRDCRFTSSPAVRLEGTPRPQVSSRRFETSVLRHQNFGLPVLAGSRPGTRPMDPLGRYGRTRMEHIGPGASPSRPSPVSSSQSRFLDPHDVRRRRRSHSPEVRMLAASGAASGSEQLRSIQGR